MKLNLKIGFSNFLDIESINLEDEVPKKVPLRRVQRNLDDIVRPMAKLAKVHSSFEKQERKIQATSQTNNIRYDER